MNRGLAVLFVLAVTAVLPTASAAQTLSLQINDGRVTLDARGVSVRQILDEWARVGQVTVVNADALESTPTTIVLNGVSERAALETLLRDAGGYMLGPRPASTTPTEIDRIFIIARGTAVRTPGAANVAAGAQPPVTVAGAPAEPEVPGLLVIGGTGVPRRTRNAISSGATSLSMPAPTEATGAAGIPPTVSTTVGDPSEQPSTVTPPSQRPPTPIFRPPDAPDPRNPFGTMPGSATPGVITPVGPPPGFVYPPVTNPNVNQIPSTAGSAR